MRTLAQLRGLPWPVARFRWRAQRVAQRTGDRWALEAATGAEDMATLLALADGRRRAAELGSASGWTAIALALADPRREVCSYDPVAHERQRYLALVDAPVRERVSFVHCAGDAAAASCEPVDLLFIDSTHDRAGTLAEFRAWRSKLLPGAVVAFHDYGHPDFPGVAEAVEELGLDGDARGGMFVWRAPGAAGP